MSFNMFLIVSSKPQIVSDREKIANEVKFLLQ